MITNVTFKNLTKQQYILWWLISTIAPHLAPIWQQKGEKTTAFGRDRHQQSEKEAR